MKGMVLALALALHTTGCAAVSAFPRPILSEQQENHEIQAYLAASAITDYDRCADKILCRNTIIDARLRAVDLAFYRFQRKIYRQESQMSLGSNMASLALDTVATVTSVGGLAAGAAFLNGGRNAYQKQVMSISLPLLFEQMTAKRLEILLRIRQAQALPATHYTLFHGLDDVSEYELAGSMPAAAAELGASVGQSARTAQQQLDAMRAQSLAAAAAAARAAPQPPVVSAVPSAASPIAALAADIPAPSMGSAARAGAPAPPSSPLSGAASGYQPSASPAAPPPTG